MGTKRRKNFRINSFPAYALEILAMCQALGEGGKGGRGGGKGMAGMFGADTLGPLGRFMDHPWYDSA